MNSFPRNHEVCQHEIYGSVVSHSDNGTSKWDQFFKVLDTALLWSTPLILAYVVCVSMQPKTLVEKPPLTTCILFCILLTKLFK